MSTFPGSPRLLKGALVSVDPLIPVPSAVVFQYNPESLTRRLEPRGVGGDGDRSEAFRLSGPPKETITLSVEIDATDQLEQGNPLTVALGLSPKLAALELMLYPKSAVVVVNSALSLVGTIEIIPAEGPMTLFVWGLRVLPVRLASLSITEEAFDTSLNPTRAKAELSLGVLSYNDLPLLSPGNALFMVHHVAKEMLAASNVADNLQSIGSSLKL
jgi:hypothetical protein